MGVNPLDKLGETVRRSSDEMATSETTVNQAKERALAAWQQRSSSSAKWRTGFALAVALAAMAFALLRWPKNDDAITYSIDAADAHGVLGAWIAAGSQSTPVRFSEGTMVTLEPGTRARVTAANAHGATMLVERGKAHAKVVHKDPTTSWLVHAGPFDVDVVGTEFDVAWDPTHEIFDIRVREGKVIVRGPLLGEGRPLAAAEALHVDVYHKKSEMQEASQENKTVENPAPPEIPNSSNAGPEPEVGAASVVAAPVISAEKPLVVPAWQKLAAAQKHREALEAAEQAGFEHILANASASVLLELADTARYAGSPARARQALVRARDLGARGRTAFLLGKIAADHDRAPAEAVTWFQRYLEESPSGGLAEQALGRIVEMEQQLGHRDQALKAAQSYLQRYPGGAYETLARRIVEP